MVESVVDFRWYIPIFGLPPGADVQSWVDWRCVIGWAACKIDFAEEILSEAVEVVKLIVE